jgi:hypothetical protein
MCERTRLGARALVRHVEELLELRIVGEEARVEVSEQRLASPLVARMGAVALTTAFC